MIPRGYVLLRFFIILSAVHVCASGYLTILQLGRFFTPSDGPQCVIEVIGADIKVRSCAGVDKWTKPDLRAECRHKNVVMCTPIEFNNVSPRWYFSAKVPHVKSRGFTFTVFDADVLSSDECIGRAFITAEQANALMKSQNPMVLSLGDGIGTIEVRVLTVKGW
eukprot:CAMPEP_0113943572 /NCGR_PEP_ID=MMETSP1339-20121228/26291_1 /TAXON_ID=94617 /ORGANISM="Fibrocapsa japonica" /LENGTH=163 /DNA_ID=CAMNT_0000948475 /DNA_START=159 /DNA_END=647 /DNA_ORIENTATION=+ /assembly_acc=CAM_ASM_000762